MGLTKCILGHYLELCSNKNTDLVYGIDDVRGVNNLKQLMTTKADLNGRDLSKFQIGGSANNKNIVIRKNDNVSDFIQLYATEDMLELGSQDDGVWKSIWKAALKSDLDFYGILKQRIRKFKNAP